jgi:Co/Zn/Cd efflux system component
VSAGAPAGRERLERTVFRVAQMDCAAEEAMVRARLEDLPSVRGLDVDLGAREVSVFHDGPADAVEEALEQLRLGTTWLRSEPVDAVEDGRPVQTSVLRTVLAINALFFAIEAVFGLLGRSMGLLADSLDMLADAFVYALSLIAVQGAIRAKKRIARLSGYGQLALAVVGFLEVARRAAGQGGSPDDVTMIVVAALALGANAWTLTLLTRTRSGDAHMRASVIFTSNDVIINLGVIAAGVLVGLTGSSIPDLVIGAVVFLVVARGAFRILALAR